MNKYQILKTLGEGGYGKALLAIRRQDRSKCVIKEILLKNLKPKEISDAKKEVEILKALDSPFIVKYIDSFEDNGKLCIVMEYADGGDLNMKITQRKVPFSEDEVLHYFIQIALALKCMHDRKILHRDIKGQNIFLCKDGRVKLGDFGIAKVLSSTGQFCQTQIGTPYYLSPEICDGQKYNSKTDVWSLGCILYELCALKHAFDARSMNALLASILRGKYQPIPPQYSQNVRGLIDRMLQKNHKDRPSINQIIKLPFIRIKLGDFLDEELLKDELNHTILHGFNPLKPKPRSVIGSAQQQRPEQDSDQKLEQKINDRIAEKFYRPIINFQSPMIYGRHHGQRIDYRREHGPIILKKDAKAKVEIEKKKEEILQKREQKRREAEEFMRKRREEQMRLKQQDEENMRKRRLECIRAMRERAAANEVRRKKLLALRRRSNKERMRKLAERPPFDLGNYPEQPQQQQIIEEKVEVLMEEEDLVAAEQEQENDAEDPDQLEFDQVFSIWQQQGRSAKESLDLVASLHEALEGKETQEDNESFGDEDDAAPENDEFEGQSIVYRIEQLRDKLENLIGADKVEKLYQEFNLEDADLSGYEPQTVVLFRQLFSLELQL